MVWKKAGKVGIDSGTLLLADPAYIKKEIPSYDKVVGLTKSKQVVKKDKTSQIKFKRGFTGAGVVTSTGFGDGMYDVYVDEVDEGKYGKRIGAVKVVFIDKPARKRMEKLF